MDYNQNFGKMNVVMMSLNTRCQKLWTQIAQKLLRAFFAGVGEAAVEIQINKVHWFDIRCGILEERGHPPPQDVLLKHF